MPKSPKRKSAKRSKSGKRIVLCKSKRKLYNPASGRCIKKTSRIGRKLVCPKGKVRNPKSKRCVKKSGRLGKKVCSSVQKRLKAIVKASKDRPQKRSKAVKKSASKKRSRKVKVISM